MGTTRETNVVIDTSDLDEVKEMLESAGILYETEAR